MASGAPGSMFNRLSASRPFTIKSFVGTPAASHGVANHRTLRNILAYLPKSNLKSARAIHGDFRSAVNEHHPRYKRGDMVTIREDIRSEHRFDDYLDPIYIVDVLTRGRGYVTLAFHQGVGEMTYGPRLKDAEIHGAKKTKEWLEIFSPFMETRLKFHSEERAAYPRGTGVIVEVSESLRKKLLEMKGIAHGVVDKMSKLPTKQEKDKYFTEGAVEGNKIVLPADSHLDYSNLAYNNPSQEEKEKYTPTSEDLSKLEEELRKLNEQKFGTLEGPTENVVPDDSEVDELQVLVEPIEETKEPEVKRLSYIRSHG
jgi:hypothetical protein